MTKTQQKLHRGKFKWLGRIFFGVGMMMIIGAWWSARDTVDLLQTGIKSPGVVVELIDNMDPDGSSTYTPVVEVQSKEHGVFQFQSSMSSSPPAFFVGEKVEVIVDPNNKERAVINSFWQKWFLPVLMTVMGSIFALLGLFQMVVLRRGLKSKSGGTET